MEPENRRAVYRGDIERSAFGNREKNKRVDLDGE
jgi:hypothetical protein